MVELDKVLRALECLASLSQDRTCSGCKYFRPFTDDPDTGWCDRQKAMQDAVALLKKQEARVLTKDEIIYWEGYVWGDYKKGKEMDVMYIHRGIEMSRQKGPWATKKLNWDEYGKTWRYWSVQPTDEQRKAVKWDDA